MSNFGLALVKVAAYINGLRILRLEPLSKIHMDLNRVKLQSQLTTQSKLTINSFSPVSHCLNSDITDLNKVLSFKIAPATHERDSKNWQEQNICSFLASHPSLMILHTFIHRLYYAHDDFHKIEFVDYGLCNYPRG